MSDSVHAVGLFSRSMLPAGALYTYMALLAALPSSWSAAAEAASTTPVDLSGLWTGSPIGSPKEIMLAQRDGAAGSYSAQNPPWATGQYSKISL